MRMKERLYLVEDRSQAVYAADGRGGELLCKIGDVIDAKTAKRYGIVGGRLSALQPPRTKIKPPTAEPGHAAVVYYDFTIEEGHGRLMKSAVCIHCGKESPLMLPAVSRPGAQKVHYYVDPWKEAAEKANPVTSEEVLAAEAVVFCQAEYEAANKTMGELVQKIQDAHGTTRIDGRGETCQHGRDEKLIEEGKSLKVEQRKIIDEIGERLRAARVKNNRLLGRRQLRIQQWKNEQEKKTAEEAKASSNGSGKSLKKRLSEVLGK